MKVFFKTEGRHHFFGYYDKCPWSADQKYLLAGEAKFIDRLPRSEDVLDIGIIDLRGGRTFKKIAESRSWNWQQGCMLQWLGPDFNQKVIFNDFRGGKFVSIILNIDTREEKVLPLPVYAVRPDGEFAVTLDFSRLDKLREGYGYKGLNDPTSNEKAPTNDGIYLLNLKTGESRLLKSLSELAEHEPFNSMKEGRHWVDHLTFSPSGERLAFLHRHETGNGGMYSRLYTMDLNGNTHLLLDSGMASHLTWKNDEEVLIWGRPPGVTAKIGAKSLIRKILVPIYHKIFRSQSLRQKLSGDAYLLINAKSGNLKKIGSGVLIEDGHASFSPNGKWLLTDTYAGKERMRKLLLYSMEHEKIFEVNRFFSMPDKNYGVKDNWDSSGLRADLHPRWNRDGNQICIDSVHEGSRQIYIIDVSGVTNF